MQKESITCMLLLSASNMLIGGTKGGNFIIWYINFESGDVKLAGSYKAHDGVSEGLVLRVVGNHQNAF